VKTVTCSCPWRAIGSGEHMRRALRLIPAVLLATFGHPQSGAVPDLPPVVPLRQMKAGQWVEKVWGDPEKPGEIFAIRIHNDAGYIAMPHVHPMDEHVVVVQGAWRFGMGSRFEPSALKEVKLGDFTNRSKEHALFWMGES
jgi:hypothetical protein